MSNNSEVGGPLAGRLDQISLKKNFSDLHPPLDSHEAAVAADRCYFCYDAPCVTACPTDIDIPLFIRQISTGMPVASAKTILDQNILGGMCARVCPTETLCEEACVREKAEGKPVQIGLLQRYATDVLMDVDDHPFERAPSTNKKIAVVGAGPAGLAAAHRLALLGNDVVILDAKEKPGGLNEFGIAAYKSTNDFAQKEVAWLLKIGGIKINYGKLLGRDFSLSGLTDEYDAVFIGAGLGNVRSLDIDGESLGNVQDAVEFISSLRQAKDLAELEVGSNVVVIGGGMTAIDAAVQSKLLGADDVTVVYRRSMEEMPASLYEQELAKSKGVKFVYNSRPVQIVGTEGISSIKFHNTQNDTEFSLPADHLLKAIGQIMDELPLELSRENNKIKVDENFKTDVANVWAGGDCTSIGEDLTVTAVAQGRDAAINIHASLSGEI